MGVNDVTEAGIAELLTLAETTPRRLAASSTGLTNERLSQPPAPEEWSALAILNHLRTCEEVWMHSLHAMLAHENPRLQEIHPRQWIKTHNPYLSQSFTHGLRVFTLHREALLMTLQTLTLQDWAREGRIESKTHTVYSHVRRMVLHEHSHCDEIDPDLKGK